MGHFVSFPSEREKRDRRDSRTDEREGQEERGTGMKVKKKVHLLSVDVSKIMLHKWQTVKTQTGSTLFAQACLSRYLGLLLLLRYTIRLSIISHKPAEKTGIYALFFFQKNFFRSSRRVPLCSSWTFRNSNIT